MLRSVVRVLGQTRSVTHGLLVALEYCGRGSLASVLEAVRTSGELALPPNSAIPEGSRISISSPIADRVAAFGLLRIAGYLADIASAMEYLGSLNCVHRDLAARNVLLTMEDVAKLADFGLGRKTDEHSSNYTMKTNRQMPVRWMAPESLLHGITNAATDVWSFGVLMWEATSLMEFPFDQCGNEEVVEHVVQGGRLDCPPGCPADLFSLMQRCWEFDPAARILFPELHRQLRNASGRLSVVYSNIDTNDGRGIVEDRREATNKIYSGRNASAISDRDHLQPVSHPAEAVIVGRFSIPVEGSAVEELEE